MASSEQTPPSLDRDAIWAVVLEDIKQRGPIFRALVKELTAELGRRGLVSFSMTAK